MPETLAVTHLKDLWNSEEAAALEGNQLALLRYRSNLLGADLRITNFGGGNTSSKIELPDPFTGKPVRVLAVKGSGGDIGSIKESGFALLYMDRLEQLKELYRGEEFEDEMVGYYPLSAFGQNKVAASIDTPLHAFIPYPHVDHLHPDWAIAIAASANGKQKLEEFNKRYGRHIAWLHWQRPGFELALALEEAVKTHPGCDGVLLGSHGLFTWGNTQRDCYENSIRTIDQMGDFLLSHQRKLGRDAFFGSTLVEPHRNRKNLAVAILPFLRGVVSSNRRVIAHYEDGEDALQFAGSEWGRQLGHLGTSCPDHFLRTRIRPMFVEWNPATEDVASLQQQVTAAAQRYREEYAEYYHACASADSPKLRDSNPSVVIVPGLGLFGFGRNKKEARITTEFFVNAIHVMAGANALEEVDMAVTAYPQSRHSHRSHEFQSFHNYVALPPSEAFRIEYWALEEAKLQRMPPEAEFSRKIVLVVGGGSGIGKEVALLFAQKGAHLAIADMNIAAAAEVMREAAKLSSPDQITHIAVDLGSEQSLGCGIVRDHLALRRC